jgi:hypothetical protein
MPFFRFMTGAAQYRIEAQDRDEALRIAFEALNPTEEMKAVILHTLYGEEEASRYVAQGALGPEEADEETAKE